MTDTLTVRYVSLGRLARVRELLEILAAVRGISEPLTSPAGLRQAALLVLRLGELLGLDPHWTERLEQLLASDALLETVLAVVRYVLGSQGREQTDGSIRAAGSDGREIVVDEASLLEWLPLVVQLLRILRQIRGE